MSEIFEIDLNSSEDMFSVHLDNLMDVSILDQNGDFIPAKGLRVQIFLTKNGMIGLGTELIRRALKGKDKNNHWHLDPPQVGNLENVCQEMGVFLHPESPEVIFIQDEFGDLEGLLAGR